MYEQSIQLVCFFQGALTCTLCSALPAGTGHVPHYPLLFTGIPSDDFLLNTLKTLFRLTRVLLDLWKSILSGAINFYLFGHPRGT